MIFVHDLNGCAPVPLAHYLKALGILRSVAEQADELARGWWEGDRFRLATTLDHDELKTFFLDRYEPTPMFNPWGGRSGFYSGSSEKGARSVLNLIENATDSRFDAYRSTVLLVRKIIDQTTGGKKPENDEKEHLILRLRRSVRGQSTSWIDAVTAIIGAGDNLKVELPALLGTGGNEGSGSYTSAYMAAIEQCLLKHGWDHAISMVLFDNEKVPCTSWDQSMGQFIPERAATPWDLLLAFEGACVLRSAVSSRNDTDSARWMSSPFYVAPTAYGYASEARADEFALNSGKELPGRGEQWFPLWSHPMLLSEVSQMFVEGRATTKRGRAIDGWSMARAVTSLGTRQGIREFVRYGYQQRNNLATHFAVPLGRFRVLERTLPELMCLDDLESQRHRWLPALRRAARDKGAPIRLALAERRLADALFATAQYPSEPRLWQAVLTALSDVEGVQTRGSAHAVGPIPSLRPDWARAADDGSAEFRLALSFALQARAFDRESGRPVDPIRRHWLPLQKEKPWKFASTGIGGQTRQQVGPEVVMGGRNGTDDAVALVDRRLTEACQAGRRSLPLQAAARAAARPADLAALVSGAVDLDRTLALGRALMALDRAAWAEQFIEVSRPDEMDWPDDAWLVIRLAHLPWPLRNSQGSELRIGADPAIFRRLVSGDASTAFELALRRLRAAGIQTTVRVAAVAPATARLWAAALAFPITQRTATTFLRRLDPNAL